MLTPTARPALAAVLVAGLVGARLLWAPGLLGTPGGEVYGHAWVQWWHGAALPGWPAGTDLATGAERWTVIDPLPTLLAAAAGRLLGAAAGYNLWLLLASPLAFLGGWRLAARVGGVPWVGAVTLALWPALMGSITSGLTEDAALGLAALGLAALGLPDWRRGAMAGVWLGLLAWCGLVSAWYAALAAVGLGIYLGARDRRAWPGLVLGGLIAAAMAAPLALMHGERLLGEGHSSGTYMPRPELLWRLNPWKGADVLSLVTPGVQRPGEALVRIHPGYLGLAPLALALLGGWSRWWPVLLLCAGVSLGPQLSVMGQPTGVSNPLAAGLALLPGGGLLNHYGRALLLGGVAMAALAARGAARLPARWQGWAAAAVAADLALLSPLPLPLPTADATPPEAAAEIGGWEVPRGRVLVLPAAGPGINFQRPLLDQRAHGHPLLLSPNRPGLGPAYMGTESGRWMGGLAFPERPPAPAGGVRWPQGVTVIVAMPGFVEAAAEGLGEPGFRGEDGSGAWRRTAQ